MIFQELRTDMDFVLSDEYLRSRTLIENSGVCDLLEHRPTNGVPAVANSDVPTL